MGARDGHIRVLPIAVANKIAAGEVVERPASVVKELVENAIDAGAGKIAITVTQGGRKLVAVQDDGCGMTRDDAVLSLERQATSKILDVGDIESIDTLGFRGEAIPSIASVSRFTITTRRRETDEGTAVQVNAGTLVEVRTAGCPAGTLVEVRDLFCNVPARRKFLRAYATEEGHVKSVFTTHALAHPNIGFTLTVDGREIHRLAPSPSLTDRVRDLFGPEFLEQMLPVDGGDGAVRVTGLIERPNLGFPTRRDQYVFVNGRPASSPSIAYALREAYPRHQGDVRPAAILFLELPAGQVDVNVHPTKREVRFRDNATVKSAIINAVGQSVGLRSEPVFVPPPTVPETPYAAVQPAAAQPAAVQPAVAPPPDVVPPTANALPEPAPVDMELPLAATGNRAAPWNWFRFLATTAAGDLLLETDAGIVFVNPNAARERIAFERLLQRDGLPPASQQLLLPETVRLSPPDFARLRAALKEIASMGFDLEEFGCDTFKVDAVPQLIGELSPALVLTTIARDIAEGSGKRGGERWREELIAKSVAKSFAGQSVTLDGPQATKLVEELSACRMPYICPRGKPVMFFMSNRELDRKFARV